MKPIIIEVEDKERDVIKEKNGDITIIADFASLDCANDFATMFNIDKNKLKCIIIKGGKRISGSKLRLGNGYYEINTSLITENDIRTRGDSEAFGICSHDINLNGKDLSLFLKKVNI